MEPSGEVLSVQPVFTSPMLEHQQEDTAGKGCIGRSVSLDWPIPKGGVHGRDREELGDVL